MGTKKSAEEVAEHSLEESTEDSNAYTKEREDAAREKLELQQEQARQQFLFVGVEEPDIEIPKPEDRPLDMETMSDKEKEALETQNEIASEGYKPKGLEDYIGQAFDSPDINPDAKEFQLPKTGEPDEFVGPEAADKAAATGFNPRTVATSTDPDGLADGEEAVKDITGRDADSIREEQGGMEDGDTEPDQGSGADEVEVKPARGQKVSKSSTDENPNRIEK